MSAATLAAGFLRERRRIIAMRAQARGGDAVAVSAALGEIEASYKDGYDSNVRRFAAAVVTLGDDLLDAEEQAALDAMRAFQLERVTTVQADAQHKAQREAKGVADHWAYAAEDGIDDQGDYDHAGAMLKDERSDCHATWEESRRLPLAVLRRDVLPRGKKICAATAAVLAKYGLIPPGEVRPYKVSRAVYETGTRAGNTLARRVIGVGVFGTVAGAPSDDLQPVDQLDDELRQLRGRAADGGVAA